MNMLYKAVLCVLLAGLLEARPDGAPLSACQTMTPSHSGIEPQRAASDYALTVELINGKVRVKIASRVGEEFQGFILQARSSNNKQQIVEGAFSEKSGTTKAISCSGGKKNTLTQVSPTPKMEVITDWTPQGNVDTDVVFRATVLKNYETFYTGIESDPVRVKGSSSTSSLASRQDPFDSSSVYDECMRSRGCFGIPQGCTSRSKCDVLLTYSKEENGIQFALYGFNLDSNEYIAMALSRDQRMGDDAVTECFRDGQRFVARDSWNDGKTNSALREKLRNSYTSTLNDDMSTCQFTDSYIKESNGRIFDLANSTYYLLLAKGPLRNSRLSYHDARLFSSEPVNFTAFQLISSQGVDTAVKIHGTFMLTAWLGFASTAILLARYFKDSWENKTISGLKLWFVFHRGFMATALTLVCIAFITIFVYKNGWNYNTSNPHAILGVITTILALIQPIMAAFRPANDHPKRPVFNWLHFAVGMGALCMAVVTIYFAKSLPSAGLGDAFLWMISVYLVTFALFYLVLQIHAWTVSRKDGGDVKMVDMSAGRNGNSAHAQSSIHDEKAPGEVLRIILLGIYSIIILVILLVLYGVIGSA